MGLHEGTDQFESGEWFDVDVDGLATLRVSAFNEEHAFSKTAEWCQANPWHQIPIHDIFPEMVVCKPVEGIILDYYEKLDYLAASVLLMTCRTGMPEKAEKPEERKRKPLEDTLF